MSVQAWTYLMVAITFGIYIFIGYSNRVRDTKGLYVAGQGVPAIFNGAATGADWMSAASFISMAGLISFMGYDGTVYLLGWTGGYVLLALLLAPYLRKYGKYTVPDFVGDRYYSQVARVVAAVAAVFISMTYVAGQMRGVGLVFSRFLGVEVWVGVVIGMLVVGFFAVLGGMKGITWTQVAQYFVLITAFLIPAVAMSLKMTGTPVPQWSLTMSDITERLNQLQVELGFLEYTQPFRERSKLDVFCITAALMVGTAGLPHIIVRFYTVPSVRAARYSAFWALFFIALLYTTAPALAVFARYNLIDSLHDKPVAEVAALEWVQGWSKAGVMSYADKNGDGILTMSSDAAASEISLSLDIVVLSAPEVANLAPWVVALVAAGGLAAALSTAAGLLIVVSSSFAHDIYAKIIRKNATEAQRLAMGRYSIIAALLVAGYFGIDPPGFVAEVVAFAFGLAAASFFPIILLGIFDSRTNREGAVSGMIIGLGFTMFYIVGNRFFGMSPFVFGISAQGIGTIGMLLNLAVTIVVSRLTPPPPAEIQAIVQSIRTPTGAAEASAH